MTTSLTVSAPDEALVSPAPAAADPEITVLVPVLDEEGTVVELTERVRSVLEGQGRSFEIVFVDDGSIDRTAERVRALHDDDPRVKLVRFDAQGEVAGQEVFASGWLQGEDNWGRPNDVLVMPDGSLLVSDDQAGVIYRISYAPTD